jgi:hypothetical protein
MKTVPEYVRQVEEEIDTKRLVRQADNEGEIIKRLAGRLERKEEQEPDLLGDLDKRKKAVREYFMPMDPAVLLSKSIKRDILVILDRTHGPVASMANVNGLLDSLEVGEHLALLSESERIEFIATFIRKLINNLSMYAIEKDFLEDARTVPSDSPLSRQYIETASTLFESVREALEEKYL